MIQEGKDVGVLQFLYEFQVVEGDRRELLAVDPKVEQVGMGTGVGYLEPWVILTQRALKAQRACFQDARRAPRSAAAQAGAAGLGGGRASKCRALEAPELGTQSLAGAGRIPWSLGWFKPM